MILIGRMLSPYVRRVATTMNFYGMPFEHRPLQHTGSDVPELRKINPLGRVPALVTDDGQVVVESSAILDYLDREIGPDRALTPQSGKTRTQVMSMLGVATGATDKTISVAYEVRFRPEEKRHPEWVERCEGQAREAIEWLDSQLADDWFIGNKMSQLDVTTAVTWQFMGAATPTLQASIKAPRIEALTKQLMGQEAFSSTVPG